jgi:hypothetical protein
MSSLRWLSLMRHVIFLYAAVSCVAGSAGAQSGISSTESGSTNLADQASNSNPFQSAAFSNRDGADTSLSPLVAGEITSGRYGGGNSGLFSHITNYIGNRIAVDLGAGFNAPIGNDIPYITWGGNFTIGGGVHVSKRLTMLVEYQLMDDKLPGGLIAEAGTQGGNAHIWSFTLDPVIDLFPGRANSVYVTGGGGFYRKLTSFTDQGEYSNEVVGHFSSNQGGVSCGIGLTHRLRWEENMRIFAEARYLFLDTPAITQTNGLGTTELFPVTIGVRW